MEPAQSTNQSSSYLGLFIFFFVVSIFVSSFVFIPPLVSLLLLIICFGIYLSERIINEKVSRKIIYLCLSILATTLGILRYDIKDFHVSQVPNTTGIVVSEPEERESVKRFVFRSDNGEKTLVSTDLYTQVEYGDRVEVKGSFKVPGMIEDENGSFDYGKYLSKDGIYHTLNFAQVTVISSGEGNSIKSFLFRTKNNFISHIQKILSEPQASLLAGLIVAGKEALPQAILNEFKRAGVIHIVVLSGYNITIIADFLRRVLEKFFLLTKIPVIPQAAAGLSILGIVLFVLMTGAQATVVRAALMAVIVIAAKFFGRSYSASRALIFVAFLMLLENPKILVFDPSFQLSFLATLGLIYFQAPFSRKLNWIKYPQVKEILAQTFATQLTVLPLLIYSTGSLSLVSIPANLLILMTVPYTMFVGFLATLLSYVSGVLAWPLSFLSHLLLSWILFIAHTLGNLKFATLTLHLQFWMVLMIYLVILALTLSKSFQYILHGDSGI